MKHTAFWILNVLADMTRCMEKQKPWAKTASLRCVSRSLIKNFSAAMPCTIRGTKEFCNHHFIILAPSEPPLPPTHPHRNKWVTIISIPAPNLEMISTMC